MHTKSITFHFQCEIHSFFTCKFATIKTGRFINLSLLLSRTNKSDTKLTKKKFLGKMNTCLKTLATTTEN